MKRRHISIIVTLIVLVIVGITTNSSEMFDAKTGDNDNNDNNYSDNDNNDNNYSDNDNNDNAILEESSTKLDCHNDSGDCYSGTISKVVDGDTIHLTNGNSIRFTLVDSPEINTKSGVQSKKYLESMCPVGSTVHVDEDDGQLKGSYGRMIGMVYCDDDLGQSLNQKMIENNHGTVYKRFCDSSEFGKEG